MGEFRGTEQIISAKQNQNIKEALTGASSIYFLLIFIYFLFFTSFLFILLAASPFVRPARQNRHVTQAREQKQNEAFSLTIGEIVKSLPRSCLCSP